MEKTGGKGARRMLAVFGFQFVERGQGNAVSAVEMAEGFKDIGFELMVRAMARECGAPAPGLRSAILCTGMAVRGFRVMGLRLRRWIGAGSFIE